MKKKIESMTAEQEAMMAVYRDEWIKIGTAYNKPTSESVKGLIAEVYELSGLKPPKKIICVDSPLGACLLIHMLKNKMPPLASVWDSVRDSVGDSVRDSVRVQNFAGLYAWSEFYRSVLGVEFSNDLNKKLDLAIKCAKSCGWLFPYKDLCIVTSGPKSVSLLDGEIHNESGPAIAYADGFSVYGLNGVRVPEKAVMAPETITLDEIKSESNAEVKRILREKYGTGKYLNDVGAKVVDFDNDFHGGFRGLLEDNEGNRYLEGSDGSTGRVYFMRVPNDSKTCRQAHEALCGMSEDMRVGQS